MALQTVLDFIARQQRYCQERETADHGDRDDRDDAASVTPELPHPNVLRCDEGRLTTAAAAAAAASAAAVATAAAAAAAAASAAVAASAGTGESRPCSLMQLRSLIPSHDDDDSSRDADHSDDDADDEDVVAHRGFATGWLPVRRRPGHIDFNQSEVPQHTSASLLPPYFRVMLPCYSLSYPVYIFF